MNDRANGGGTVLAHQRLMTGWAVALLLAAAGSGIWVALQQGSDSRYWLTLGAAAVAALGSGAYLLWLRGVLPGRVTDLVSGLLAISAAALLLLDLPNIEWTIGRWAIGALAVVLIILGLIQLFNRDDSAPAADPEPESVWVRRFAVVGSWVLIDKSQG